MFYICKSVIEEKEYEELEIKITTTKSDKKYACFRILMR